MNDDALILDDQHTLNAEIIENNATIENSESSSSFKSFDFDSNSVFEQLLCFSPATSVQNSDSDPEYLPSKKTSKTVHASDDHPKSTCRRSTRLSTFKDENPISLLSLLPTTSEDPEYFPPKGILYALKKSVNDSVPKSDIITNVKQRKQRRSKKFVDPACNNCNSSSHEKLSMSCSKIVSLPDLGINSSPLSTDQLRQILEGTTIEDLTKEKNTSKKENRTDEDQEKQSAESINHDSTSKEDNAKNTTLKMPRTRSALKLKVKKRDKKVISVSATAKSNKDFNSEVSDTSSQYKVSKDKVLPKTNVHKESKKVPKRRKRQTCRKQFRHKDITLYKLGADPDPVNEAIHKNQVIHKIFLRRSSVSTPPLTPHTSKVTKTEEVSENVISNANSNGDNKCSENLTVKPNNSLQIDSSTCGLNKSNKIYCSSISIENHNMNKVPKVILTPINTTDNYYQKSATVKEKTEVVPQQQITDEKLQDINSNFKNALTGLDKSTRNEIGKHNLPIRIPERRTSIAEPLRTPPTPNNKAPSFQTDCLSENQFSYMKIEIKKGLSDNQEVIYVKPTISQEKLIDITKPLENIIEPSTVVSPSMVSKPLHNETVQSSIQFNKENLNAKENGSLPVINNGDNIVTKEVVNNLSNVKLTHNRGSSEQAETHKNVSQETQEAHTYSGPQNLSIKVVKSCSGITDPLKLHKTNNLPCKKIDSDSKSRVNSVTPPKKNHGNSHQLTDNFSSSVAQTIYPINTNEMPHKSSPILQQNLLNGPVFKSDIYRNSFQNRGNISMNNFNSEISSYALNSLAVSHTRTPHSNTVSSVSRNMPIIEETNQQISNDNVTYEILSSTSPFATDSSKKNKKGKRKLSRSDTHEEISPKLQRSNNYQNYPSYNYPLSFYSGASPNQPYNPLSPFPLGIPHSAYNMGPPVYQPKPSNCTGQSSTFERTGFRNIAPPPLMNPFFSHDPRLPVSTYSPSNSPASKTYDSRMHYNHFMRFSNPMFMNHNTLPPDYGCNYGINNSRNEVLLHDSNSILQQGFDFSSKNFTRGVKRQSPHQMFSVPENTHRRSSDEMDSHNKPLALIKNTATTQCNDWGSIPIASRNEELTITKLPFRENLPKTTPALTAGQTCAPENKIEDFTVHSKEINFRQKDGNTCSIVAISKSNAKNTESSGYPCSKTITPERRSGVGSVLHGELANISISIIKNKNENNNKPAHLSQQGLLPIFERANLAQKEPRNSVPKTTKVCEVNASNSHPTNIQNVQPMSTPPKVFATTSAINKDVSDEKTECAKSSNSKTSSPANIYRDIELEINCTKITKPLKNTSIQNMSYSNYSPINSKAAVANACSTPYNGTEPKRENKIGVTNFNDKVDQSTSPSNNLENIVVANTELKVMNEGSSSVVTILSDPECELDSPNNMSKTTEAINLSVGKPSEISSATSICQNKSVTTSEAVMSCPTADSSKSSNISIIASIMQHIIHQGDVRKFDQYVETIRRSLENRETYKLDALKQTCSQQLIEKIADDTKTNNSEKNAICNSENVNTASAVSENISVPVNFSEPRNDRVSVTAATSECIRTQDVSSLGSGNLATSKTVRDLTKTLVPSGSLECEPTSAQVSQTVVASENIADTRNAKDSQSTMLYKHMNTHVSQAEEVAEHINLQTQNTVDSECHVDSDSIAVSKKEFVPQCAVASEHTNGCLSKDENVPVAESITNFKISNAVTCEHNSTQPSQTVEIRKPVKSLEFQNVATYKTTEDSRKDIFSQSVVASKYTNAPSATVTDDSRISAIYQSAVTSHDVNVQVVNSQSVLVSESAEISINTAVAQCSVSEHENAQILSSLVSENISATTELLATEIKKELVDDDDDVIFVYNSNERVATSTEDKGIQADISTLFPLNTNYSRARIPKRKKWRFSDVTNSTQVPKMCKTRTQGMRKAKTTLNSRHREKSILLNKQFDSKNFEVTQNQLTCSDAQNRHCIRNSRLENTKTKFKNLKAMSATTSTKPCQTANNSKLSSSGSLMSKTLTTITKPCQFTNNKLSGGVSQMPKTSTSTSTKPCQTANNKQTVTSITKLCQTTTNKHSGSGSQMSKTSSTVSTKTCQGVNSKLSAHGSQVFKTSIATATTTCQASNTKPPGDGNEMSKTLTNISIKPCQTANNKLSADGTQMSKTSTATSTKLCQTTSSKLSGDGCQMSKHLTTTSTKPCQTANSKLSGDGFQLSKISYTTTKPCENANNIISDNASQMPKISTTISVKPCQTANNTLFDDSSPMSNKNSKKGLVNKRSSKRLLLKQGMKSFINKDVEPHCTHSKATNVKLLSARNREANSQSAKSKQSHSHVVASAVQKLHSSQNIKSANYALQNSEIIQTRCFVRLSRILENSETNNIQTKDSKVSIDTEEEKPFNQISVVPVLDIQPTSDLVKTAQEADSLGEASPTTSDSPALSCRYDSSRKQLTDDSPQELQKSSSLGITSAHNSNTLSFISKCANNINRTGNLVEISENTSYSLPDTNKDTGVVQMSQTLLSPSTTCPQIIETPLPINPLSSGNQAIDGVIQIPQKSPSTNKLLQQTITSRSRQTTSNSIQIQPKSPSSSKMSPQVAEILPADFIKQQDHRTNIPVQMPLKSPSGTSVNKTSSFLPDTNKSDTASSSNSSNQFTNNSTQMPQKLPSASKSTPTVVFPSPTIEGSNNYASNNSIQLSQESPPLNKLPKQISISSSETVRSSSNNDQNADNSVQKLQQSPRLKGTTCEATNILGVSGAGSYNQVEKNSVQISTKHSPLNKLSNQTQSSSLDCKASSNRIERTNNPTQETKKTSPSPIADIPFSKDANTYDVNISNLGQVLKKSPAVTELLKQTSYRSDNNNTQANNYSVDMMQQSLGKTSSEISDILSTSYNDANNSTHTTSKLAQVSQQSPSLRTTSPCIVESGIEGNSDNHFNNPFQLQQQSKSLSKMPHQILRSSSTISNSANSHNQITNNLIKISQKSSSDISDVTNNSIPTSKESFVSSNIVNNLIEISQNASSIKPLPLGSNANSNQITKDSLSKMLPNSLNTVNYSAEIPQKSQSFPKKSHLDSNTTPAREQSPSLSRICSQISTNNYVKTPQNSPSLARTLPQDSTVSSATYRSINNAQVTNKPILVSQKSPSTSNMMQQTFSDPTDLYRYVNKGYQIGINSTPIMQQSPSCTQISPQFANPSSVNNNCMQTSPKTYVGRTSYQISKTPPIAHRRTNSTNQAINNSIQILQQPPLLNTPSNQVTSDSSDIYAYGSRNMQCEIDLTVSSKSTNRGDVCNRLINKKDPRTPEPKTSKRSVSKYEDEDLFKIVSSNTVANTYQPYVPFQAEGVPFGLYPSYPQKGNDNRPHNEFAKKIQGSLAEHPSILFPTNQEMRENPYSSSSSSSSQFSPTFRQPSPMLNKLYTKTASSKQVTEAKNKDVDLRNFNTGLRQHVTYSSGRPLEQTKFSETQQSQSSETSPVFTDPKQKYETLGKSIESGTRRSPETNFPGILHKKRSKEDQKYLNIKAPVAHPFNGNLSPDYGYFSPLTKNAPPSFESIVYRPNPIRYNESNSFHNNMKYRGVATALQNTPMNTRETYQHANSALPIQNNGSNNSNTCIRQNSKLSPNTATLSMANGIQNKVQQPDVDKISSILPKLQQSETLNPEQYVFEMSLLEKDGCPRSFLEFYSFVTKKQISSNQLPISFKIFLEFHNAGKLKNFENAFRIYSERHEKEKKLMLKSP